MDLLISQSLQGSSFTSLIFTDKLILVLERSSCPTSPPILVCYCLRSLKRPVFSGGPAIVAASAPLFDNSPFISLLVLLCFADCIQHMLPSFLGISPWFNGHTGSFFRNEHISSFSGTAPVAVLKSLNNISGGLALTSNSSVLLLDVVLSRSLLNSPTLC
jgi:hypothetical protein